MEDTPFALCCHWNRAPSVGELTFGPRLRDTQPMVASTPQPPSGGMVGKKELLQWASQASGRIVTKFDELKDGDVLLRCMKETWPAAYDRCRRKGQPRSVSGNFELMGNMFEHLELPKSVLDTRGIQHASFKSCYNFLVMAFFLKNLATHSDFSVDFTHPVDSKLAAFLQAPESVASLHKGGALAPPGGSAPKTSRGASSSARSTRDTTPRERSSSARRDRDDALESASAAALRAEAALANEEANRRALLAATSTSPRRRRAGASGPGGIDTAGAQLPSAPAWNQAGNDENAAPPVELSRERSALQQARDARRKQARAAANTNTAGAGEGLEASSGSVRRVDSLLGRGGNRTRDPKSSSSSRRRPRIDGSSSEYGTSDGDMAPGGPQTETNRRGGGLTRGAVAEILSRPSPTPTQPAPNERQPRTTPHAPDDDDARASTPRSPPLSPFRSVVAAGSNPASPQTLQTKTDNSERKGTSKVSGRLSAPPAPLLVPGPDASGRLWANADAADRGETQLAEARFELEQLRRLLDASKRERDLLERRFDVELDAREARFTASTRAAADDARARIAARELQLAAERNADQRAYLHELRLVAEEVAAARVADDAVIDDASGANPRDDPRELQEARVRARLDAVRGREVRALEARVQSLETERAGLAEALRAATEAASVDDPASGSLSDKEQLNDVAEKSPAAASAIRRERAKCAELAQRVRVLEATLEGERAGREREREEFKARASLGTHASGTFSFSNPGGLESDRPPPSGSSSKPPPFASPRAVAAPSPVKAPTRTGSSLDDRFDRFEFSDGIAPPNSESDIASGDTYRRILAEQRGERKIVRLEAELAKLRTHNEALRRQMRAVQAASFEDVAVIPPSDPAEADATRRAEEEAHRLGADGAAADAAALLKAIDALRVAASRSSSNDANDGGTDIVAGALAAAADAEAATWRRAAAAAVQQRKIARLRGETRAWRAALEDERTASRDAGRAWRKIKSDLETARDEAIESYRRERATGGVRASLAEEAAELAREEARAARRDAADAFAARDAATGASAGALREARDEAAKLRLRESHWVGLIGCHRESSRVSRELAELATLHGGEAARLAVDAAAGPGAELARRRAAAEAEAESHVEAIKAIADMIEVREAARGTSNAIEFGRAVDRAEAAEASLNATRDRLHVKSEEAAALALKAKRHELRAAEESAERERAQRRAESVAAELARLSDETSLNQRRASEEMARAREELARLREALDDRDAALGAGAELVERDPELARTVSEGKAALDAAVEGLAASAMKARAAVAKTATTTPTPGRRGFFGFGGSRVESSPAARAPKEGEGENTPSPAEALGETDPANPPASVTRGTIASPGAVAAAVAAATQALVSPKGESPANLATLDTSPIIPAGPYGGSSVGGGGGGEGGESPYDFLIAGGSAPRTNPLDDLAAAASAFKRGGVDESFGSSAPTQSTSKRRVGTTADGDDDDTRHKMSGGSPVQWLGSLLSPSAARRAAAIPLSEANTDADDTDAEEGAPNDEPREVATAAASPSPGLFGRFLRRSPSPGKTRMDISPGALENPRVSRIRAESGDEGGGMSRGTSSENLSVMTGPTDSPPSESAASSLPGADEFLHKADKRLEIKVEKSWFGLGSSPSPVRIKVRTGGTSDESSDDARDRDVDESSPTSKMTGVTRPLRTPGGSASKKWPSPASVVKSASRAENRAAAEFIAAAEEAARRSASTTPGKGGRGGSAVQSPAQRREERKRRAEAEAAARRSPYSDATGGSLTTGGGLPTGSDFFNQATQEKSWMQGLGSPSPSSKRRDAP
ncbi:hypothetical protein MICPUN_57351 [Micromonas commoda]|uniref:Calponin-homology (CH) domain-containing protein n=1 Tax=Micromonas commoda (strain RCC299 / NOUM17 / CCMP2709) TaxID=296587 RepID=C1E2S6_MICCC|nr:hypothetical protein MICPUN_57351 [Micromonas commoda]ACO62395.1 hypothetical protein MICPUN_57351 [Micromonas commoda]|eukprot:XP_002501137.1 hypothetical protein MICPUN_57351 [Micromonas commoda]